MIVAEFKSPDDFEMVLKDIDEDLCKEKERNSATEVFMDSNSRAKLSDSIPQLTKSHADQDAPRVSSPLENARTPPSWTRKTDRIFQVVQFRCRKFRLKKELPMNLSINLSFLPNVFKVLMLMIRQILYWWRLVVSPTNSNELSSMELSWA